MHFKIAMKTSVYHSLQKCIKFHSVTKGKTSYFSFLIFKRTPPIVNINTTEYKQLLTEGCANLLHCYLFFSEMELH